MLATSTNDILVKSEPESIIDDDNNSDQQRSTIETNVMRLSDPIHIYTCYYCHVEFESHNEYISHANERHDVRTFKKMTTDLKIFTCNFCANAYDLVTRWRKHERVQHIVYHSTY